MGKKESEIDSIFASAKSKQTSIEKSTSTSTPSSKKFDNVNKEKSKNSHDKKSIKKKSKIKEKGKEKGKNKEEGQVVNKKSTSAQPQIVLDPSQAIASSSKTNLVPTSSVLGKKRKRSSKDNKNSSSTTNGIDNDPEQEALFADSRGTSSRKKTDDGLPIYDINELNIGHGGDTPLCPIDCNCCF